MFRRNRHGRSIKLGTLALEGVRPVVEGRLFTKAGRVSMRGLWGEKPVKIFECASSGHAGFVGRMMMEAPCARFFPDVYAVHERLVICEWVRGRQISPRTIVIDTACRAQLEELVASLRGAAPPTESGFDYVEDFVLPRFRRCCVGLGLREFQARIETHWDVMRDRAEGKCVSHPDLSPANMIMTAEGQMKIVDNELLGMSRAPWFDELNMAFALGGEGIRKAGVLRTLLRPLLELTGAGYNEHLVSMWLMRLAGTLFVAGDLRGVIAMAATPVATHLESSVIWRTLRAC